MTRSTPQAVALYELYPRRADKPAALRAIQKALDVNDFEFLKEKTTAFAERVATVGKDKQHIPYPATWFNREGYNEDLDDVLPLPTTNGHHKRSVHELRIILKAKEDKRAALRFRHRTEGPTGNSWDNESKRLEAIALTKDINAINEEIAGL